MQTKKEAGRKNASPQFLGPRKKEARRLGGFSAQVPGRIVEEGAAGAQGEGPGRQTIVF